MIGVDKDTVLRRFLAGRTHGGGQRRYRAHGVIVAIDENTGRATAISAFAPSAQADAFSASAPLAISARLRRHW